MSTKLIDFKPVIVEIASRVADLDRWCEARIEKMRAHANCPIPTAANPKDQERLNAIYGIYNAAIELIIENFQSQQAIGEALLLLVTPYLCGEAPFETIIEGLTRLGVERDKLLDNWAAFTRTALDRQIEIIVLSGHGTFDPFKFPKTEVAPNNRQRFNFL